MLAFRTRRAPVLAGVALLAVLIGISLALLLRNPQLSPAELASYLPARNATVFFLDVAAVRSSGLLEKLVGSSLGEAPDYRRFIDQTGFDYKRDLDQVMLSSAGGVHYLALQGRFDWKKLARFAEAQGGSCKDGSCQMKGSTPDRIISWRRLKGNLMGLASARDESGARAIARRSGLLQPFAIPAAPVWLHVPADAMEAADKLPAGTRMFAKALEPAERTVFTLGPENDRFELGMDAVCRSAEDAATLKAQLEGLTKLLNSLIKRENKAPRADDLSGVLTSGTFDRLDTHVRGRWAINRAFVNSLGGS